MTIKEHYGINSRKSIKPYLKLIVLFVMFITISWTFARYTYTTSNSGIISIAKWNIEINGQKITNETSNLSNISLLNVEGDTTIIDSGDECYFDIIINPTSTEVAISYSISIDLDESNLPSGTKIIKYEKYNNTEEDETLNKTQEVNLKTVSIEENINLPDTQTAMNNESIRRYRFYCKIPFPADIEKDNDFTVMPKIAVQQYIR